MKSKMFFRMITASLIRRKSRMLIALLAVAIGATILSGLITVYIEVPRQMGEEFRNYGANVILTPVDTEFTKADLEKSLSYIDDSELVGATPYRYENVSVNMQPVVAAGVDMENLKKTSPYWLVEGDYAENPLEFMAGKKIAETLGLKEGDVIYIRYTSEEGADKRVSKRDQFKCVSIISTGGSEENFLYMSLSDLENLTEISDSIDLAEVSISANADKLTGYTSKINENVPALKGSLVKRVTASETTVLSKLQALILLVTVVILALTMICVATTMMAVVTERRQEIGLRKAIGASDKSVIIEFMGEGMMLGFVGGILGSVLGFMFAEAVSINVFGQAIIFRPLLVPITIIVSVSVTGLACIAPIRGATKVDPALVLKGE